MAGVLKYSNGVGAPLMRGFSYPNLPTKSSTLSHTHTLLLNSHWRTLTIYTEKAGTPVSLSKHMVGPCNDY